jgi:hypothetical protein
MKAGKAAGPASLRGVGSCLYEPEASPEDFQAGGDGPLAGGIFSRHYIETQFAECVPACAASVAAGRTAFTDMRI